MPHFAEIDENDFVLRVIVADQEFIDSGAVGDRSNWKQTSYNSRGGVHFKPNSKAPSGKSHLRKNFAGVGYTYDQVRDAFIPPKPYDSWVLNEDTCVYDAPIAKPDDSKSYKWDETTLSWKRKE